MDWQSLNVVAHVVGVALGVGGASATYLVFFKAINDDYLSKDRFEAFETLSKMIWVGLAILIISGIAALLFIQVKSGADFVPNEKVWSKLAIVVILLVNGILMNKQEVPLIKSWVGKKNLRKSINEHRSMFFTTGAISLISWYAALFLGAVGRFAYEFEVIFGGYLVVIALGIVGAIVTAPNILKQK